MDQGLSPGSVADNRDKMARFLVEHKDLIKARFRAQLESEPGSLHDSSDFFASMLRRMDGLLANGGVDRNTVEFLQKLYLETVMDYTRAARGAESVSADPASFSPAEHTAGVDPSQSSRDDRGLRLLCEGLSEHDEQIIRLRATGLNHKAIAQVLGLSASAVRQRWSRLLRTQSGLARNKAS